VRPKQVIYWPDFVTRRRKRRRRRRRKIRKVTYMLEPKSFQRLEMAVLFILKQR
jgi:hypothetical protein